MASTRVTLAELLKKYYKPGLRKILNDTVFLLTQVEKSSEKVEGSEVVLAIRIGRNQGIGARAESGTLPTAGQSKVGNVRYWLAYNYGRIQISGPLMRSGRTDRGSFARPIEVETKGVTTDLRVDINRQLYGNGTGAIAAVTGANTTTSIPVALTTTQMRHIVPGMVIDVGPAAGAMKGEGLVVASVTSSAVVVTVAPGSATASTDFIYRAGNRDNELTGLNAIIAASGALYGLNPATAGEEVWKSPVMTASAAIAENMFTAVWQEANIRSDREIDLWITTNGIHRDTSNLFATLRRFNNPVELKGGYRGLDMAAIGQGRSGGKTVALVYDKDCPTSTAFGVCTEQLQMARASDWEFMDEDGDMFSRVPNMDAYEATLFQYSQLVTEARNAHGKIQTITEPTTPTIA